MFQKVNQTLFGAQLTLLTSQIYYNLPIYNEVVHWRNNLFTLPSGNVGKSFVAELARLFYSFAEETALESISFLAVCVMGPLLLQRPHKKSKTQDHVSCLKRRLSLWKEGKIEELLFEGRSLQQRLPKLPSTGSQGENLSRTFSNLVFQGKIKQAIQILSDMSRGRVLHVNDQVSPSDPLSPSVLSVLKSKHPTSQPCSLSSLIQNENDPPSFHPIVFDQIDANCIRVASINTFGAAGPSGIDAHSWKRFCTSFQRASDDLCHALALVARRLCTSLIDPELLQPLLACRLIALDKNPGVRPIGICEVIRRILAKAALSVIKNDIIDAAGPLQLCAGQPSGAEAAIHAVRSWFEDENTEGILLVDASNAFNSLNRQAALRNIQHLCPTFAPILTNCYREPSPLFVDNTTIWSEEGTTQGDPLAMPFYALATIPLIKTQANIPDTKQIWYADDSTAAGSLKGLRTWWDSISTKGPSFGYFANDLKSWLITKPSLKSKAEDVFRSTNVKITTAGRPHLGAPLGSDAYVNEFLREKVNQWCDMLSTLSDFAIAHPQAAYSTLTHGLSNCWSYLCRTNPHTCDLLQPLEDTLNHKLIPALTGRSTPSEQQRRLFSLPVKLGGLGISSPTLLRDEFTYSLSITTPLTSKINSQQLTSESTTISDQFAAKAKVKTMKRTKLSNLATELSSEVPPDLNLAMTLAQEQGASSWLSSLPIREHGFTLHKGAFRDALALRYGWQPTNLPSTCTCGSSFTVEHALSCPKGGFPTLRHNEVRDFTAQLLSEVCSEVCIEPKLQPLTGEHLNLASAIRDNNARLDISANGFWGGSSERAMFDVRVFNPYAPSNKHSAGTLSAVYKKHEKEKKRAYGQRVRDIEFASFSPLVFSLTGGLGREASCVLKRLASLLAAKWQKPYSTTLNWMRTSYSFALIRSSIRCLRGARSRCGHAARVQNTPLDVISAETHLN